MASKPSRTRSRRRLSRALILTLLIATGVAVAWFAGSPASRSAVREVASRVPLPDVRGAVYSVLRVIRAGLGVTYLVAAAGAAILGWRVARGRRLGVRRLRAARGLLACCSILFALGLLEVASFGWQSWSHRTAIAPAIARSKGQLGADAIYVVVLGESSARGVPYSQWLSIGHILEWQLQKVFPGRVVRVDTLAHDGATMEVALRKFDGLMRRPDAVILYSGHNEIASRFPLDRAVPYYTDELSPLEPVSSWFRGVSPLAGLVQEWIDRRKIDAPPDFNLRRLVDVPACSPAESAYLVEDFRARLEALATYCEKVDAVPILLIPPGNDAGFEPNRSILEPSTPKARREAVAREFAEARAAEAADPSRSLSAYRSLIERHPGFAEAHYRLAILLERSGAFPEADTHYASARDLDGLPIRCTTAYQDAYRAVASRHECILIDGPEVLRKLTKHGILDDSVFHDAQHPTLIGYVALAREILAGLRGRGAFGWPRETPAPEFDPAECAARFEMDWRKWTVVCMYSGLFDYGTLNLRYENKRRLEKVARYKKAVEMIGSGVPPEDVGIVGLGTSSSARRASPK